MDKLHTIPVPINAYVGWLVKAHPGAYNPWFLDLAAVQASWILGTEVYVSAVTRDGVVVNIAASDPRIILTPAA